MKNENTTGVISCNMPQTCFAKPHIEPTTPRLTPSALLRTVAQITPTPTNRNSLQARGDVFTAKGIPRQGSFQTRQLDTFSDTLYQSPMYVSQPYHDAVELQRLILKDARSEEIKPVVRAAIARAFCELEETKRKLKMKPLPGSLRPTSAKPQRRSKQPDFEPAPAPPASPTDAPTAT